MRLIILIIVIGLVFHKCRIYKPIQVKEIVVRVIKVEDGWTTWKDDHGMEYYQETTAYPIGFTKSYLITR
jgi:hypothetical protein